MPGSCRLRLSLFAVLAAGAVPAPAQLVLQSEDVSVKFGIEGQVWADWTQDAASGGYVQNLYIRRIRLMASGNIGNDITFFIETDDPKLGLAPKALNAGFLIQDAFVEWKVRPEFRVDAGLMIVPFSRNALQSTLSFYTLDVAATTTVNNASTQSSALRDAGFGARGFFLGDHLQYRTGLFQGERDANGRNSLRAAGYVQVDFFAPEPECAFTGTAIGRKKILAVNGGFDKQADYRSLSGDVTADYPVHHGDEIGGQFQFTHFDGRRKFPAIANQNDYLVEAAYFSHRAKLQPFGKYEAQRFVAVANQGKNVDRYGGGVNYYIRGQSLKWTFQYLRSHTDAIAQPVNEFSMQMQMFYF
jgi:hypothetical protein